MAEGDDIDVKSRVIGVLDKLKDCSVELLEIGRMMADARDGSSEETSGLVRTVLEMLGALETGVKRVLENEKSKEESSRSKQTRSGRSADPGICTRTCVNHPEIVNPGLWSKLTENLVGVVFARLPIPRIIELRKSSEAWAALSDSASFRGAFAEANPKLFGLLGYDYNLENSCTRILNAASKEWHGFELLVPGLHEYRSYEHACDGGLMCYISDWDYIKNDFSVFVCNPLTTVWRKLPDIWETFGYREVVMVQLVTNELFYRVILVYSEMLESGIEKTFGAFVYNSRAGSWSVMSSGLVYGTCDSFLMENDGPHVFDCATKRLIRPDSYPAFQDLKVLGSSILKDRLFVLHAPTNLDLPGDVTERFVISEFTWESSRSDLRKLNDYEVALGAPMEREYVEIFTSTGFILVTGDYRSENESVHQLMRIYDVSVGRWRDLPPLVNDPGIRTEKLEWMFMCDLRWDANP